MIRIGVKRIITPFEFFPLFTIVVISYHDKNVVRNITVKSLYVSDEL